MRGLHPSAATHLAFWVGHFCSPQEMQLAALNPPELPPLPPTDGPGLVVPEVPAVPPIPTGLTTFGTQSEVHSVTAQEASRVAGIAALALVAKLAQCWEQATSPTAQPRMQLRRGLQPSALEQLELCDAHFFSPQAKHWLKLTPPEVAPLVVGLFPPFPVLDWEEVSEPPQPKGRNPMRIRSGPVKRRVEVVIFYLFENAGFALCGSGEVEPIVSPSRRDQPVKVAQKL